MVGWFFRLLWRSALLKVFLVLLGLVIWGLAHGPCANLDYQLIRMSGAEAAYCEDLAIAWRSTGRLPPMSAELRGRLR
jgi:hypothetical protein